MRSAVALFALCLLTLFHKIGHAGCGASSCPIEIYNKEKTEKGWIRIDYSQEYIDQNEPRIGRRRASVGELRGHHDEIYTLNQINRIGLDVGFTRRFSFHLSLPFVRREHQHIHHHQGNDLRESWNFNGIGDLTALGRYQIAGIKGSSRVSVFGLLGGKLPTGRDEVVNAEGDQAEVGLLPGTGAYTLTAGVSILKNLSAPTINGLFAAMPVFFTSTYEWNETGREDYKIGNVWLTNVGTVYPLLPKVGLMLQTNVRVNRRDDRGATMEEIEKTGGAYVYLSPGLQLIPMENLTVYAHVQVPVYQRVNRIQLTSDYNLITGISYRFNVL